MSLEPMLNWLGSSAAPGWIAAFIMLMGLIINWLRGRARPSRIIVEQVLETTLLSAPKDLHDVERVRILYAEEPIDMLWMTELRLRNVGKMVIAKPKIYFQVDDETKVLDIRVQEVPPGSEADRTSLFVRDNTVKVAYPYLNPFREHKQETTIKVLCDRKPQTLTVEGGGKGWSIGFIPAWKKQHVEEMTGKIWAIANTVGFAGAIVFTLVKAIFKAYPEPYTSYFILACFAWILVGQYIVRWVLSRQLRAS